MRKISKNLLLMMAILTIYIVPLLSCEKKGAEVEKGIVKKAKVEKAEVELSEDQIKELIDEAIKARKFAYAPYSKFKVGAALLTKNGKIFTGCNVECASYGGTNCAERTAIFKAVSEGEKHFEAIAIVLDPVNLGTPCGICRQVIYEFGPKIKVIMANLNGEYEIKTIEELLPYAFGGGFLE